jgi:citrate synthase
MTYDPVLMNTASTKSTITFIDGDKGILEYRGYPIETTRGELQLLASRIVDSLRRTTE